MINIRATNITSPLGLTTAENYAAVKRGESSLHIVNGCLGVPGSFCVGAFSTEQHKDLKLDGFSWFESLIICSVKDAIGRCKVDVSSSRTAFIVGTATAGIEELGATPETDGDYFAPGLAVKKVAKSIGFINEPIVVSNACISGATAQILAARLIEAGFYEDAVVCGVDVLSAFVLAGFSSFKALSPYECRPFDINRLGLNIGECAATMILSKSGEIGDWNIVEGCMDNDAYHVSAPIPDGDGVRRTIEGVLTRETQSDLACITAHGTATMFNDQMESKAIDTAGLGSVPTMALKPFFGHTFGASGVVEAIISMCAIDEGLVIPVKGFEEIGVSGKMNICNGECHTDKHTFLKIQSGFGGCNGSILYSRKFFNNKQTISSNYTIVSNITVSPDRAMLDGERIPTQATGFALITEIFKCCLPDSQKFHKMDMFSRLAYLCANIVTKDKLDDCDPRKIAMIVFTQNGSLLADRKHLSTFCNSNEFYPSPAVFIYTLPNVVLGEIALKINIKGETDLVILPQYDETIIKEVFDVTVRATNPDAVICGWVDCDADDSYNADIKLYKKQS